VAMERTYKLEITPEIRAALTWALGEFLSQISENAWAAGWMSGCEESIPEDVATAVKSRADGALVSAEVAVDLAVIASLLGHWVQPGPPIEDDIGFVYIPHTPEIQRDGRWPYERPEGGWVMQTPVMAGGESVIDVAHKPSALVEIAELLDTDMLRQLANVLDDIEADA